MGYDSFLSQFSNSDKPNGGNATFDLSTGSFKTLTAGHFKVSFSGRASVDPGEELFIYIYRNENRVEESKWYTHMGPYGDQNMDVEGSRSVILHLERDDSVTLRTENFNAIIHDLVFCVS